MYVYSINVTLTITKVDLGSVEIGPHLVKQCSNPPALTVSAVGEGERECFSSLVQVPVQTAHVPGLGISE